MLHLGSDLRAHQPIVLAQLLDVLGVGKAIELGSQCFRFSANDAGGQGTRQGSSRRVARDLCLNPCPSAQDSPLEN